MRASLDPQVDVRGSLSVTKDLEVARDLGLGAVRTIAGSGATPVLDTTQGSNLQWTPDHATPSVTCDGGYAGKILILDIITWGSASTITFSTGFKVPATLVIGTTTGKKWTVIFKSDGTNYWEISRSAAVVG